MPLPTSFVVKNGSKRCARTSGVIPWPVSRNAQQHVRPRRAGEVRREVLAIARDVRGLDDEPSAVRHRIAGVHGEVEQDLLHLRAIRLDLIEVRRQLQLERDVLAEQPPHQVARCRSRRR